MRIVRHSLPELPDLPKSVSFPGGTSAVDLGAVVEAILSGTAGFARDPIAANLFQDTAGATPVVSVSDPIGRINCQWGSAPPNWQQATALERPAWDGTGASLDGTSDYMATFSALGFSNNVPGLFHCERVLCADLAAVRPILSFSQGTAATLPRFALLININGSIASQNRRLDLDATTTITSGTGLITAGVAAVISWQTDYAGTGLAKIWLNGTEVASAAIAGVAGNTEATNMVRAREWAALNAAPPTTLHLGWARRSVTTPFLPSTGQRADIEAWVGAA